MLHLSGKATLSIVTVLLSGLVAPAFAADMLYDRQRPVAQDYRPVRTAAYVEARPANCDELVVEYRAPLYTPRTEIVRFCNGSTYRTR